MKWQMLPLRDYIIATRPWSLSASFIPTLFGNILAYRHIDDGTFSFAVAFGTMVCVICVHIAGNLFNTYYDFRNGIDGPNSDDKTLVDGKLKPQVILNLGVLAYTFSCLVGLVFIFFTNINTVFFILLFSSGAFLAFQYTGGLQFKYWASGDIIIILTFGPIAILFTYFAQTNELSWEPVFASFPLVCLTEAILHANNTRDLQEDAKKEILTLAILLGDRNSCSLYTLLVCAPFIYTTYLGLTHSYLFLLPLFIVHIAVNLIKKAYRMEFDQLPQNTAELNLLFGGLYSFIYLLS